jgi:thiol:disulfide interchange protein DsbG
LKLTGIILKTLALTALTAVAVLALMGCSPKDAAAPAATASASSGTAQPNAAPSASPYEAVAAQGKGFTVGAMMAANPVYVMFDPQCPHCGHLWEAAKPLQAKVKFVWVPVSFINAKSAPQGATLLSAANPGELMNTHEASILAGTGGTAAASSIAPEMEAAIKSNTALLNSFGAESVPFIVAKNTRTGQVVTKAGAMDTATLADFLGVSQP